MTPEKLNRGEAGPLMTVCNHALSTLVEVLSPIAVIGVGRYAERRAREVLGGGMSVGYLPHPSPASPAANRGWPELADAALASWLSEERYAPDSGRQRRD